MVEGGGLLQQDSIIVELLTGSQRLHVLEYRPGYILEPSKEAQSPLIKATLSVPGRGTMLVPGIVPCLR